MALETCTLIGRIYDALALKTNATLWVALGRTTAWSDEQNPPAASPSATTIEEPIVYVKIPDEGVLSLCKRVESSEDVVVDGTKFDYVADGNAYTENAHFLFIQADYDGTTMPYANYRQKAIFADLTPASGHESDTWLAPANVEDEGVLLYLCNKTEQTYGSTDTPCERTVLEFR